MEMPHEKGSILWFACLVLAGIMVLAPLAWADGHEKEKGLLQKHLGEKSVLRPQNWHGEHADKGNETTGQIAAWSLAAANLTVVISVLIKGIRRFAPVDPHLKESLLRFNHTQKKHLMVLHTTLNPLILGVALTHYALSRCSSTSFPEWGLLIMGVIVLLGITLKFKLCPKEILSNVHRLHTQPTLLMLFVSMLFVGHMILD